MIEVDYTWAIFETKIRGNTEKAVLLASMCADYVYLRVG